MVGSAKPVCKPFKNSHDEQIKLVTSFDWLDPGALHGIDEEFGELLSGSPFIDEERRAALSGALRGRLELLAGVIKIQRRKYHAFSVKDDVRENVAYSGLEEPDR